MCVVIVLCVLLYPSVIYRSARVMAYFEAVQSILSGFYSVM